MDNRPYGKPNEGRLPPWLKKSYRDLKSHDVKKLLRKGGLNTVCESAKCPNIFECFSKPTAAFMILGNVCTRNCGFCAVSNGQPLLVNPLEPEEVAKAVEAMRLKYVVITSVTRDDLRDGGAKQFALTISAIKKMNPHVTVEILTPDFCTQKNIAEYDSENLPLSPLLPLQNKVKPPDPIYNDLLHKETIYKRRKGDLRSACPEPVEGRGNEVVNKNYTKHIEKILNELLKTGKPDIFNHNVETIPRLYPKVRPQADYSKSLKLLETVKKLAPDIITKSGIMAGLGEKFEEVVVVMRDLRNVGCDVITIGQYLQPSKSHLPVEKFIYPEVFGQYEKIGNRLGFKHTASGPFVRSSYNAERQGRSQIGFRPIC